MDYICCGLKNLLGYIAIIIVLASSFLPGQGFAELNKIPTLIGHYNQHKLEFGKTELSFSEFLMMHYNEASSHKTEENHEDLPMFHSCCNCQLFIVEETLMFQSAGFTFSSLQGIMPVKNYLHLAFKGIFQPPKFS